MATYAEPVRALDAPVATPLVVAAVASLSAGAVHAAAIGAHAEHRQAALVFTGVAAFQLAWGAAALAATTTRRRVLLGVGALGNAALVGGWAMAKTHGVTFIKGLDAVEPVQFADALCAALAALAAVAAVAALLAVRSRPHSVLVPAAGPERPRSRYQNGRWGLVSSAFVVVLAASSVPGMVQAGRHVHQHDEGTTHVHTDAAAAVVPPHPYDPTKPIDLSGVPGVTPEQQARAENLIAITLARLPKWSDPAVAEAAGFQSIGDGITGYEHLLNWDYVNDDVILDPDRPESLVYRVQNGVRTLEAAMFMLRPGATLDDVPDIGGKLTQWHIHNNLCFTATNPPKVVGLTDVSGQCRAPLVKGPTVPMIHVWIVSKPCGPFAALEGIGGGQIKAGETRLCDHVHGTS